MFDIKSLNLIQQADPIAIMRNSKAAQGNRDEGQLFSELLDVTETQRIERRPENEPRQQDRNVETVDRRDRRPRSERREESRPVEIRQDERPLRSPAEPEPERETQLQEIREPHENEVRPEENRDQTHEPDDQHEPAEPQNETGEPAGENPDAEEQSQPVEVDTQVNLMVLNELVAGDRQGDTQVAAQETDQQDQQQTERQTDQTIARVQQQATGQQIQQTVDTGQTADVGQAVDTGQTDDAQRDASQTRRQVQATEQPQAVEDRPVQKQENATSTQQAVRSEQVDVEAPRPHVSEERSDGDARDATKMAAEPETGERGTAQAKHSTDAVAAAAGNATEQQTSEIVPEEGESRDGREDAVKTATAQFQFGGGDRQTSEGTGQQADGQAQPRAGGESGASLTQADAAGSRIEEMTGGPQRNDGTARADQQAFVDRVIRSIRTHFARDGGGRMTVQLDPPNLGRMTLDLRIRAGVLTASVETTTEAARSMITAGLSQLRGALSEQGITVERFEVHVANGGQQARQDAADGEDSPNARHRRRGRGGMYAGGEAIDQTVPLQSADLDVVA